MESEIGAYELPGAVQRADRGKVLLQPHPPAIDTIVNRAYSRHQGSRRIGKVVNLIQGSLESIIG